MECGTHARDGVVLPQARGIGFTDQTLDHDGMSGTIVRPRQLHAPLRQPGADELGSSAAFLIDAAAHAENSYWPSTPGDQASIYSVLAVDWI